MFQITPFLCVLNLTWANVARFAGFIYFWMSNLELPELKKDST